MDRFLLLTLVFFLAACNPSPRPINYGIDTCSYCKMNIVNPNFASELVTQKGKVFTYDAIECMVNDLHNHKEKNIKHLLVKNYNNHKGSWIPAQEGVYLISDKIQSPMGANLGCFKDSRSALELGNISIDSLLSWDQLKTKLNAPNY